MASSEAHKEASRRYRETNREKIQEYARQYRAAHRDERQEYWKNRVRAIKAQLVEEMGGGCNICGYNRSLAALDFDHLDPTTKTMEVSKLLSRWRFDEAIAEAKKCRILCANCHREQTHQE